MGQKRAWGSTILATEADVRMERPSSRLRSNGRILIEQRGRDVVDTRWASLLPSSSRHGSCI